MIIQHCTLPLTPAYLLTNNFFINLLSAKDNTNIALVYELLVRQLGAGVLLGGGGGSVTKDEKCIVS